MATQTQRQVEAALKFGGKVLCITAQTRRGPVETVYLVDARPGRVDLVTDEEGREGEVYTVYASGCSCADWRFRGRKTFDYCKHRRGLAQVGLLPPVPEPEREDHDPRRDDEGAG